MSSTQAFRFLDSTLPRHVHEIMLTRRGREPFISAEGFCRRFGGYEPHEVQWALDELVSRGDVLALGEGRYAVAEKVEHVAMVALALPREAREALVAALSASLAVPT